MRQRTVDGVNFSRHINGMKTGPGLSLPVQRVLLGLSLCTSIIIAAGCNAKPTVAKKAPYPSPYVVDTAEIMQRDAVKTRARELIDSGKYKNSADARRAAEKEYPPVDSTNSGLQDAEYYRWKQQQEVQSKFETDLDKMKRKS